MQSQRNMVLSIINTQTFSEQSYNLLILTKRSVFKTIVGKRETGVFQSLPHSPKFNGLKKKPFGNIWKKKCWVSNEIVTSNFSFSNSVFKRL